MGKISPRSLTAYQREFHTKELRHALKTVKQRELPDFLLYLLTESEQIMTNRRIAVAKRLLMGHTFDSIRNEFHVGQATIEKIHQWLYEAYPDYRSVLPKLYKEEFSKFRKKQKQSDPYTLRWLFKKYPMHFWIYTLILDEIAFEKDQKKKRGEVKKEK